MYALCMHKKMGNLLKKLLKGTLIGDVAFEGEGLIEAYLKDKRKEKKEKELKEAIERVGL